MTRIIIEALPPDKMRLEAYRETGCGDWFWDREGNLHIQVAGPDVWDHEDSFLIALHEMVEARLCFKSGVTQGAVDSFDATFTGGGEPGEHKDAPYRKQHRAAGMIEHLFAIFLGRYDYGEVR